MTQGLGFNLSLGVQPGPQKACAAIAFLCVYFQRFGARILPTFGLQEPFLCVCFQRFGARILPTCGLQEPFFYVCFKGLGPESYLFLGFRK